jgi:hypothetical protein
MTRITIDGPIVNQLGQVAGPVELFDATGRFIGNFTPASAQTLADCCPYSEEEIAEHQRRAVQGGKKLKQMLSDLGYPQ